MPVKILFKNELCEWIDVEAPNANDLQHLQDTYKINKLLLDDTIEPNHLPKFEQHENIKFFLTREFLETERQNLNTISDVSTKLSFFLLNGIIITVHRTKNKSIQDYVQQLNTLSEPVTAHKIALNLALKVFKSYDNGNRNLIEEMDQLENDIFIKKDYFKPNRFIKSSLQDWKILLVTI